MRVTYTTIKVSMEEKEMWACGWAFYTKIIHDAEQEGNTIEYSLASFYDRRAEDFKLLKVFFNAVGRPDIPNNLIKIVDKILAKFEDERGENK